MNRWQKQNLMELSKLGVACLFGYGMPLAAILAMAYWLQRLLACP